MEPEVSRTRKGRWPAWAGRNFWMAVAATLGVTLLLVYLSGYFHRKVGSGGVAERSATTGNYLTVPVRRIEQPRFETAVGTVKPIHEIAVASNLLARVIDVRVKAGQPVAQGELLVKLDDADLIARVRQAEAALQAAEARRERALSAQARTERLLSGSAVSKSDHEAAVAEAQLSVAEVARQQQALQEAQVVLAYAEIKAPVAGTIVDRRVETGDTVSPGQILLTMYDPGRMQLVARVRESLAQQLQVGQRIKAQLESMGYACEATISEIVPEATAASRSFQVKVTGPCPPGVYSGMFGRISIPLEPEQLLVIPESAVRRVGQLTLVDVQSDGKVVRRSVQLGRQVGSDVEVLAGLSEGQTVVINQGPDARELE